MVKENIKNVGRFSWMCIRMGLSVLWAITIVSEFDDWRKGY